VGTIELQEGLIAIGKELYDRGLQTTRSGNISAREGDRFIITKTGAHLGRLAKSDLISVDISAHAPVSREASCESPVHRAIYNATGALAIDNEGLIGFKRVPIVDTTVLGLDIDEKPSAIVPALTQSCMWWFAIMVHSRLGSRSTKRYTRCFFSKIPAR
jgi:Class II Aldolase and Adducin N-terminal domain